MANFPHDLSFDVLSRLPVKYVLRFRCVCKSWCSLISEPQFVKTHLNHAITDITIGCQRILIPGAKTLTSIDYEEASQNHGGNVCTLLDLPWISPRGLSAKYAGSSHGMVCVKLFQPDKIVLCNPSTREFRELPTPISSEYRDLDDDYRISCGLGYDSYADDYKIVDIFLECGVPGIKVEIFSLRSNSWMIIQDTPPDIYSFYGSETGVFLNGAIHWIACLQTGQKKIISFDLATEKFQKMLPLPPKDQRIIYHNYTHLILLRGCLSVSREFSKETEVWVMKEYGVEASWTKLFTLREPPTGTRRRRHDYQQSLRPVCFSKNGELLVEVDSNQIRIYNPKEERSRELYNGYWWLNNIITYNESLVSPNGNAERNQPS